MTVIICEKHGSSSACSLVCPHLGEYFERQSPIDFEVGVFLEGYACTDCTNAINFADDIDDENALELAYENVFPVCGHCLAEYIEKNTD